MSTRIGNKRYTARRPVYHKKHSNRTAGLAVLVVLVLALVAGISVYLWSRTYYADRITAGVTVNGQSVAGIAPEKLRSDLRAQYDEKIAKISVKIDYDGKSWEFNGQQLGAEDNVDDVVDEIAKLARTGEFSDRRAEAARIRSEGYDASVSLKLNPDRIEAQLQAIAEEVNLTGKDATVSFDPEPNDKQLYKKELSRSEIRSMFTITEGSKGLTVDVEAMMEKITEELQADFTSEQQLIVNEYVPKYTKEMLSDIKQIAAFDTKISGASERKHNITLALSKVNGTTLWPGEEFSFNDTTGPRSKKNGYLQAHVIGPDKTLVDDWGGGVCQASTTLYNAALMANMEITDRSHHSFPSSYVRYGFDAMVNYPTSDLKFKNIADSPVYIKAFVSGSRAYVIFLGAPLADGMTIERESVLVDEGELPEPEIMVDKTGDYSDFVLYNDETYKVRDSYPARTVEAYLIYKDKDGKEIDRKKLYTDRFKAIVGLTVTGKDPRPTPTPGTPTPVAATPTPAAPTDDTESPGEQPAG